ASDAPARAEADPLTAEAQEPPTACEHESLAPTKERSTGEHGAAAPGSPAGAPPEEDVAGPTSERYPDRPDDRIPPVTEGRSVTEERPAAEERSARETPGEQRIGYGYPHQSVAPRRPRPAHYPTQRRVAASRG